jgi:hypothetical protein
MFDKTDDILQLTGLKTRAGLWDAGFNLDAFLAKQDDFYEMLSEVMSLHKVFIGTGGRIV